MGTQAVAYWSQHGAHKMQYFFDIAQSSGIGHYKYTRSDIEQYVEPAGFTEYVSGLPEGRAKTRATQLKEWFPRGWVSLQVSHCLTCYCSTCCFALHLEKMTHGWWIWAEGIRGQCKHGSESGAQRGCRKWARKWVPKVDPQSPNNRLCVKTLPKMFRIHFRPHFRPHSRDWTVYPIF